MPAARQPVDSTSPVLSYNYFWWPLVDSQAFMAIGLQGQAIYVDPSTDTVIVKLSYFPPGNHDSFPEALEFFKAASRWDPSHPTN